MLRKYGSTPLSVFIGEYVLRLWKTGCHAAFGLFTQGDQIYCEGGIEREEKE